MLKADLHIHSTVSDGSECIPALISAAIANGLDAIAITDHDTLSHKKQLPKEAPISVMAGIEISAIDPHTKRKAHILGYHIQDDTMVETLTAPLLERRHHNSLKQIHILQQQGYHIDINALNKADGKYIYKQHIMEYLYKTHQVADMFGLFYQQIFKNGGICDFDIEYINVFDAVKTITAAGGKAVLAHSGQQKNFDLIDSLVPCGLKGLEYNHPANSVEDKKIILEYAQKYQLFLTGGSDFHGSNDKIHDQIGDFICEPSGIAALY